MKESVCPGIQLMLSLSRLLERQQEELPHIYWYKSSWKYFRSLILIVLSIPKSQQQEHSQILSKDGLVHNWVLVWSIVKEVHLKQAYMRLRDATSREEGSLEENLKRWVLLDHSHHRGISARRCFCIWENSNLEGEVSSPLNHLPPRSRGLRSVIKQCSLVV